MRAISGHGTPEVQRRLTELLPMTTMRCNREATNLWCTFALPLGRTGDRP